MTRFEFVKIQCPHCGHKKAILKRGDLKCTKCKEYHKKKVEQ